MAIKKRKDKFEVGDLVQYVLHHGVMMYPVGTIGVVTAVDNNKGQEHTAVVVYFQRPSKYNPNQYEGRVRRDHIVKMEDMPEALASAIEKHEMRIRNEEAAGNV